MSKEGRKFVELLKKAPGPIQMHDMNDDKITVDRHYMPADKPPSEYTEVKLTAHKPSGHSMILTITKECINDCKRIMNIDALQQAEDILIEEFKEALKR